MRKYILIIDDNKYLLDILMIRLSRELKQYTILTARNGKKGIEILKSVPVDFVLTDLEMPEMDGYQFIAYAREHFPSVPVYAMSNDCRAEAGRRLRAAGIGECIEKPFLAEEVMHRIVKRHAGERSASDHQAEYGPSAGAEACILGSIPD